MIRVTIELDSFGLGTNVTSLGEVIIANDGTGTRTRGNYKVKVYGKTGLKVIREGRLENWPRLAKHPVDLVAAALEQVKK